MTNTIDRQAEAQRYYDNGRKADEISGRVDGRLAHEWFGLARTTCECFGVEVGW